MNSDLPEIYANDDYIKNNVDWHIEDSIWKSEQVYKSIKKNKINSNNICEVGCGAGEIIRQLSNKLPESTFVGYEPSEIAFQI